jgi:two-component system, cell cycle sensor histidine kinase and response regulator CckA
MQRIFEPFYTTRGLAQRSGMGLAVVHGIVENHGGHMSCESNLGSGTVFKIYLPALTPEPAAMDFEGEAAVMGGSETILLTDDEELITDLGKRILTRAGYTVLVASNGRQAADLYREKQGSIAMVILDLIMPGMGGKQCLREILAMDPRAKVLVASGRADMANKQLFIEAGAKGFVSKPFTLTQLLAEVRKVLDAAVS